ncbi:MAG: hypothetical protein PHT69_05215 [Bacteroidales bacterium]|nr:hypothetical protein [Bacteroidales bacterium]
MRSSFIILLLYFFPYILLSQTVEDLAVDSIVIGKYKNGFIKNIIPMKNGVINGWEYQFYDFGAICSKSFFLNGVENGVRQIFGSTNRLQQEIEFNNGKIIWSRNYNFDGALLTEVNYIDSLNYDYIIYQPRGIKVEGAYEKGSYRNGKPESKQYFNKCGELISPE